MRVRSSARNIASGLIYQFVTIILGFLSQALFIRFIGIQYAGISGVLNNLISFLNLAELGIGTAMIYSLYEPIATQNTEKIKSLMKLYKRTYGIIGMVIATGGLFLSFFIQSFFKDLTVDVNLRLVLALFVSNSVFSYFYSYKRSLLYADQCDYINKNINLSSMVLMHLCQIISIIVIGNYYIFLLIRLVATVIENLYVSNYSNRKYPYLIDRRIQALPESEKFKIVQNIKALFFHKIGTLVVFSTDSIIVSSLVSVASAGVFSTYQMILRSLNGIISTIFDAVTASFGNLLVLEKDKSYLVFKNLYYLNFVIATVSASCLLNCLHPFMSVFLGYSNAYPLYVDALFVLQFFLHSMRASVSVGRNAAGIYRPDRFVPLWEGFVNLVVSLVLTLRLGIIGVIIGTIASSLLSVFISLPYILYHYVFEKSVLKYYGQYLHYFGIALVSSCVSAYLCSLVQNESHILGFFVNGSISLCCSVLVIIVFTHRSNEFHYFLSIISDNPRKLKG